MPSVSLSCVLDIRSVDKDTMRHKDVDRTRT